MHLITFAHWPEARAFFDHFSPTRHPKYDWAYEFNGGMIIITGEGIHEALSKTVLSLGLYPQINEIYNFGVAGTLSDSLPLHDIKEVRTVYGFDSNPLFKSFTLHGDTDLVTSGERVLTQEALAPLKTMGKLVDRELWGVAFAAKEARLPLRSFKYISDKAGEIGACEMVKELADVASLKLLEIYLKITPQTSLAQIQLEGLYFTFTQEKQLESLLQKLSSKFDKDKNVWLESPILKSLQTEKLLPKERTKRFLSFLSKELDPFTYSLHEKVEEVFSALTQEKIILTPMNQMETKELKVQFSFQTKEELIEKTQMLKNFDFEKYYSLWRGNLDVE
ncbi:MAG: hypothetical protein ACOVP4_12775 [Bacteriovoracaceae bacterium]